METTGIQLHEKQIEAINNGAGAFILMINEKFDYNSSNDWFIMKDTKKWKIPNQIMDKETFIKNVCPLKARQKFYVQEVFTIDKNMGNSITYQSDFQDKGTFEDWCEYSASTYYEAERMTYKQSRLKDFTTSTIEVKRVQDLDMVQQVTCLFNPEGCQILEWSDYMIRMHVDSIYGQGTYESNPYCFICTFKKE